MTVGHKRHGSDNRSGRSKGLLQGVLSRGGGRQWGDYARSKHPRWKLQLNSSRKSKITLASRADEAAQ